MLDPCISYEGMKLNYAGDDLLAKYLESLKTNLYEYYETHYANKLSVLSQAIDPIPGLSGSSAPCSPQKNFTSQFQQKAKVSTNELDEFFKLSQEDFDTCNPIHWWLGHRAQFPNLFWLACDILCIPSADILIFIESFETETVILGSAVAVEQIFSGGVTQSRCSRQVFGLRPLKYSCLLKKASSRVCTVHSCTASMIVLNLNTIIFLLTIKQLY